MLPPVRLGSASKLGFDPPAPGPLPVFLRSVWWAELQGSPVAGGRSSEAPSPMLKPSRHRPEAEARQWHSELRAMPAGPMLVQAPRLGSAQCTRRVCFHRPQAFGPRVPLGRVKPHRCQRASRARPPPPRAPSHSRPALARASLAPPGALFAGHRTGSLSLLRAAACLRDPRDAPRIASAAAPLATHHGSQRGVGFSQGSELENHRCRGLHIRGQRLAPRCRIMLLGPAFDRNRALGRGTIWGHPPVSNFRSGVELAPAMHPRSSIGEAGGGGGDPGVRVPSAGLGSTPKPGSDPLRSCALVLRTRSRLGPNSCRARLGSGSARPHLRGPGPTDPSLGATDVGLDPLTSELCSAKFGLGSAKFGLGSTTSGAARPRSVLVRVDPHRLKSRQHACKHTHPPTPPTHPPEFSPKPPSTLARAFVAHRSRARARAVPTIFVGRGYPACGCGDPRGPGDSMGVGDRVGCGDAGHGR